MALPRDTIIPNAVILPRDATGQPSPSIAVQQATKSQTQVTSMGRDSTIPILYGGPERMAGKLYCARIHSSGSLMLCLILCEGGTLGIEEIGAAALNDQDLTVQSTVGNVVTYTNGVVIAKYLGTLTQAVDPLMAATIPTFAEAMLGTAYIVCLVPPGVSTGYPRFNVLCKGLKLYDPRYLFKQIKSDILTSWVDFGTSPGYQANSREARDGTQTAHSLLDLDGAPGSGGRKWTWTVPDDSLRRSISISINKAPNAVHQAGLKLEYLGGTVISETVRVNPAAASGATAVSIFAGSGATIRVVEWPQHFEVVLSMVNNHTGNTSFVLSLYPSL